VVNLATLRVEGNDTLLDILARKLSVTEHWRWKKGDPRRNGRTHSMSGFSVTVADAANPGELVRCIRTFLEKCKTIDASFAQDGLMAELSVGFTVGDSEQFIDTVEFAPSDLLSLAECGVTLSVTAYPTSDEANAAPSAI
jgi:hypothetical protein